MFPQSVLAPWARLLASLTLEVILVVALAALLARVVLSASGQRMVWRTSFVVLGALVLAELSGVGHSLLRLHRLPATESMPTHTVVVTTSPVEEPPPAGAWSDVAAAPTAPAANSRNELVATFVSWLPLLALAGLAWFGARRSFAALKLLRLGNRATSVTGSLAARVEAFRRQLGIRRRVRLRLIAGISSPIAYGIVRPTVGIPKDFSVRFTAAQQEAMLAHELAHVAAFDAVWMLLADLTTALLWWHPGDWWARRQLRAATETAADEASLLLDDGPATLAECLVTLGELLTRSPDPGGLGMAGFRSQLGRRVERLLNLRGPQQPWSGKTAWLARLLVPAALLGLALAATAWLLPPAVDAATVGESFQRSPLGLATTALLTADKHDSPRLIYKGPQYYDKEDGALVGTKDVHTLLLQGATLLEAGKTNEAEMKWRTALELEPGNKVALDYLRRIGRTNPSAAKPEVRPTEPPISLRPTGTNISYTSTARQRIYRKLNTIRFGSVKFDNVPLNRVIEQVLKESQARDPERKGINIIINAMATSQQAAPTIDPVTGLPMTAPAARGEPPAIDPQTGLPMAGTPVAAEADINAMTVKIDPELHDVTLGQVLDIIVKVADRPIQYSVVDYGVVFSIRGAQNPVLHTRWYKMINTNTFTNGLKSAIGRGAEKWQEFDKWLEATQSAELGKIGDPPKTVIFNDRLGMLMVRATLEDLDVIEQAVQVLNTVPPDASPRHDQTEEAIQALTAGFPAANLEVSSAPVETGRTPPPPSELHTRWWKIDAKTVGQGLQAVMDLQFEHWVGNPRRHNRPPATNEISGEEFIKLMRTYLQAAGVVLDPPKSIIFADRRGMLMVRATLEDLDVIEQAVQVLNMAPEASPRDDRTEKAVRAITAGFPAANIEAPAKPVEKGQTPPSPPEPSRREDVQLRAHRPQVHIEVRFYEVHPEDERLDFILGQVTRDSTGAPAQRTSLPPLYRERQNAEDSRSAVDSGHRNRLTNGPLTSLQGILTPQQYRDILRAMEERGGVTFLRTMKVTVPSGRQAQVKSVEVRTIVTGLDTTNKAPAEPGKPPEYPPITAQFELGPMLDVVPYVAADGRAIQMTVIPSIKEFLGYDVDEDFSKKIWDYVPSSGANPSPRYPLPIFRLRQVVFSASVWDGQTIVLASGTAETGVPDGHIASKLPRALAYEFEASIQRMKKSPPKIMLVFVTPIIIDPAGNRVHRDADLPARTNSVPSQLPQER